MPEDQLRYDHMVEDALRTVVRQALGYVAEHGLPGNHHFYITFNTDHPDVVMPAPLRARYQGEMTIVLQHQFWDLDVGDKAFGVSLSFSDVRERLSVPYDSVIAFADPSVRFALQFDNEEAESLEAVMDSDEEAPPPEAEEEAPTKRGKKGKKADTANVITLDTFRKK